MRCLPIAPLAALLLAPVLVARDPAVTIYNQQFAVIREILPLDLHAGDNNVHFAGVTAHVEPESVIIRDPAGRRPLVVLEQNYRSDTLSQGLLLALNEGNTIAFRNGQQIIPGKIIRSGYVIHYGAYRRYGSQYAAVQQAYVTEGSGQPIIEVDGQLRFSLPGEPIFPSLGENTILQPTLDWLIRSPESAAFDAELSYVSGGMSWSADYNVIAPETGDLLDLVGWVTLDNQTGRAFENARIKLVAGDVSKLRADSGDARARADALSMNAAGQSAQVTERPFDEYHLYTLPRATTLRDRETKQVEFLRAAAIQSRQLYIYDGSQIDPARWGYTRLEDIRNNPAYGAESNPKVWVMREFQNSEANHLGLALPKGRVRFYRRDRDGQMEFTGENLIDHTSRDERVRLYTGNAFDLTGERRQTNYTIDHNRRTLDETIEVRLRNHKKEAARIRVVEHLYRGYNWTIPQESDTHRKLDSRTMEYEVSLPPDQEKVVTYTVHYSW
jgi:hypothetical protein